MLQVFCGRISRNYFTGAQSSEKQPSLSQLSIKLERIGVAFWFTGWDFLGRFQNINVGANKISVFAHEFK